MFIVVEYMNQIRNFSIEVLDVVSTIEEADKIALSYAENKYGFNISNVVDSVVNIKNIISEYSINDGMNHYVYAIIKSTK